MEYVYRKEDILGYICAGHFTQVRRPTSHLDFTSSCSRSEVLISPWWTLAGLLQALDIITHDYNLSLLTQLYVLPLHCFIVWTQQLRGAAGAIHGCEILADRSDTEYSGCVETVNPVGQELFLTIHPTNQPASLTKQIHLIILLAERLLP